MTDEEKTPRDLSRWAMFGGLVVAYGWFGSIATRFLLPARGRRKSWQYIAQLDEMSTGASFVYQTPTGELVNITRQGSDGGKGDFIALSSTCPHLGCQVSWEGQNNRYFCPCHNGTFDPSGVATGGPPGEAGQSLPRYDLKITDGLLFIEVPEPAEYASNNKGRLVDPLADRRGPGHDPCLGRVRGNDAGSTDYLL